MNREGEIGTIERWADFSKVMRERADGLGLTRQQLDEIAGLTPGYSAKLLSTVPMRQFAEMSFDSVIGALGIKFVVIEDKSAADKTRERMVARKNSQPVLTVGKHDEITIRTSLKRLKLLSKKGVKARARKLSPKQRKLIAKHAANQRWIKVRELQRRREERLRLKAEMEARAAAEQISASRSQGSCQNLSSLCTP